MAHASPSGGPLPPRTPRLAHGPGSPATYPPGFAAPRIGLAIRDAPDACRRAAIVPPTRARGPRSARARSPPRKVTRGNSTSRWNGEFCARPHRGSPSSGRIGAEPVRFARVVAAATANAPEPHVRGAVSVLRPPKSLQTGGFSGESAVFSDESARLKPKRRENDEQSRDIAMFRRIWSPPHGTQVERGV